MFISKPKDQNLGLEKAIDQALTALAAKEIGSDDYTKIMAQLKELYSLKELGSPPRISPDTLAIVVGNLLGIVFIVGHERANVVTSKALSFVMKLR